MVRPQWTDRLSGTDGEPVPYQSLSGQLMLTNAPTPVYLNDRLAALGDYLVPGTSNQWSVWQSETGPAAGRFVADALPDSLTTSGVLEVAQCLAALDEDVAGWTEVPPLIQDLRERLETQPLEQRADEQIDHLRSVCWDPADRLVLVDELMPVPRARRIAPQAVRHLSHHSEHWQSRTLEGVRPARILASRPQDDIDRYENRVAARLTLNLLSHVRTRLAAATKLDAHMAKVADYDTQFGPRPSFRNAHRLATLLDRLLDESAPLHDKATSLLGLLGGLDRELTALLGSPVVRKLADAAAVPPKLRPTNLFTNDHRYRQVRELWEAWIASRNDHQVDWGTHHQQWCRAFERYALLVVLWAGNFLGLDRVAGQPAAPGAALTLTNHPAGDHMLHWNLDATFTLSRGGEPVVRIVPLAHALTSADSADEVARCIAAAEKAAARSAVPTLVLYPGSQEERHRLPADLRLRAHVTIGPPSLVPVSPAELDSIERVARALRWYVDSAWLQHYPPRRAAPGRLAAAVATGWLDHRDQQLRATRPPDRAAWAETNAALRQHAGPPRAIHRDDPATQLVPLLDELRDEIATFTHCLVCRRPVPPRDFQARKPDTFWAECTNCKVKWGLRSCGSCGGRYPVLSTRISQSRPGGHGDALDRAYGNELLAEPCRQPAPDQPPTFICTSCGVCPAGDGCES
jgi:hypothetical protein